MSDHFELCNAVLLVYGMYLCFCCVSDFDFFFIYLFVPLNIFVYLAGVGAVGWVFVL